MESVASACTSLDYTPCYCEENIWKFCKKLIVQGSNEASLWVIFISNPERQIPLWRQKRAKQCGYVIWDYHVVLMVERNGDKFIYDFDTNLPFPCDAELYWKETLFQGLRLPEEFTRMFRVIGAADYIKTFSSDRRHMINEKGEFMSPPPPWPVLYRPDVGHNLDEFINMESNNFANISKVYDEEQFWNEVAKAQ